MTDVSSQLSVVSCQLLGFIVFDWFSLQLTGLAMGVISAAIAEAELMSV
jgi:hypothetical protein